MSKKKGKNWTRRGLEWVMTGGGIIVASFLLPWAAPFALALYGGYRWLFHRTPVQGASIVGASLVLWVLLMGPLAGLFWPLKMLGALCAGSGVVMLLVAKKTKQLSGDDRSLIVDPQNQDKENQ